MACVWLQSKMGTDGQTADTLKNLTVFLTLQKAEEKGFTAEKYGLSPDQAADLASVFAKYDVNDDMVLEASEVRRLL
jgi:hypothetical protein